MKRSKHSLSHYRLFSADMGYLVPCGLVEVLPGDTFQHSTSALVRMTPLATPVMHPIHANVHHWYVPTRLLWEDFEDFITGGPDNDDASVFPTIDAGAGFAVGSLADYLGCPTGVAGLDVSAIPFRAYAMIYNEWYRDQDLQTPLTIDLSSGPDTTTSVAMMKRAWEKDYFTSARPWPQKGPDVTLPLGTTAPVITTGVSPKFNRAGTERDTQILASGNHMVLQGADISTGSITFGTVTGLQTDLTNATAASINALREAFALQNFAEARARFGSRYTEYLRYMGVNSSDARLQRPEYLGGGKQTLQISEVLQTGVTTDGDDSEGVGNLKGHGIGAMRSARYRRFFEEHGYVLTFFSVKPKTMYFQGLNRTWDRRIKEDFFQKEFQHIGSQEIKNKELYAGHATPEGVFGYQDRYDDYRRVESGVAGEFRTTYLDWHMGRDFSSDPTLNSSFIQSTPTKRIFADQTSNVLLVMAAHSIQARRLLSKVGYTSRL